MLYIMCFYWCLMNDMRGDYLSCGDEIRFLIVIIKLFKLGWEPFVKGLWFMFSPLLTLICYVFFLESQAYYADYLTRAVESGQVTVKGHAPHRTYIIN